MSFYEKFVRLCDEKGVKPGRAASDCGINRSNVTSWKNNGYTPRGEALQRIAAYFGVSSDSLLGLEKEREPADNGDDQKAYSAKLAVEEDSKTPPSTEERQGRNVIKIAGRNGVYRERILSDSQLAALESILDQLPDASDDL